jgi:ParB-like chromosome segregation protein Spo0J
MFAVSVRAARKETGGHDVAGSDVHNVPVKTLELGDSPRLGGINDAHVRRLLECGADLSPIVVHRQTMRVIDGMHRLQAAIRNGHDQVQVKYFDGDDDEAFVLSVELNVKHGLPLSLADRRAAAQRILASGVALSDRALASKTGLSDKTIAAIRTRSGAEIPHLDRRRGRDGRAYPISGVDGRQRAAQAIAGRPGASLREIASAAGVSPAVASDVRRRMSAGEEPGPRPRAGVGAHPEHGASNAVPLSHGTAETRQQAGDKHVALKQLRSDPSVRGKEAGRELLRWLSARVIDIDDLPPRTEVIPPHRLALVGMLARSTASAWLEFARRLETAQQQNQLGMPWTAGSGYLLARLAARPVNGNRELDLAHISR